jgi:uncharacterized protein YndB with AHSA1/START domain
MESIAHRVTIKASRHAVFTAISTIEGLKGWYAKDVKGKSEKDGELTFAFPEHDCSFRWKLTELEPDSLVRWHCEAGPGQAKGTDATFRLSEKAADKTVVEFDHEGFRESDDKLKTCNTLWGSLMLRLKNYAETKQPQPALL